MGPLSQSYGLLHHVNASHQGSAPHANGGSQSLELTSNLNGQLSSGGQDQGKERLGLVQKLLEAVLYV